MTGSIKQDHTYIYPYTQRLKLTVSLHPASRSRIKVATECGKALARSNSGTGRTRGDSYTLEQHFTKIATEDSSLET